MSGSLRRATFPQRLGIIVSAAMRQTLPISLFFSHKPCRAILEQERCQLASRASGFDVAGLFAPTRIHHWLSDWAVHAIGPTLSAHSDQPVRHDNPIIGKLWRGSGYFRCEPCRPPLMAFANTAPAALHEPQSPTFTCLASLNVPYCKSTPDHVRLPQQ